MLGRNEAFVYKLGKYDVAVRAGKGLAIVSTGCILAASRVHETEIGCYSVQRGLDARPARTQEKCLALLGQYGASILKQWLVIPFISALIGTLIFGRVINWLVVQPDSYKVSSELSTKPHSPTPIRIKFKTRQIRSGTP